MDEITKTHDFHPVFSLNYSEGKFDDAFHECVNEASDDDMPEQQGAERIINHNDKLIAYYSWPSLIRIPQLENEQHTQITKTFAYYHDKPIYLVNKLLNRKMMAYY